MVPGDIVLALESFVAPCRPLGPRNSAMENLEIPAEAMDSAVATTARLLVVVAGLVSTDRAAYRRHDSADTGSAVGAETAKGTLTDEASDELHFYSVSRTAKPAAIYYRGISWRVARTVV